VLARQLSTPPPTVLLWRARYPKGRPAFWKIGRVLAARRKFLPNKKPPSSRPPCIALRKTRPIGASVRWQKRSGLVLRPCNASGRNITSNPIEWKHSNSAPLRSSSPKFVTSSVCSLNPPDQATLRPGLPERQTHDYERHGTTTSFAALNVAAGKIIAQCQPRHRHQEFLRFLKQIDTATDPSLEVHLILDNYGTHKHPDVKNWFRAHPRYQVHFTPTSASWLNQVERWFAEITRKRICRGTFRSVRDLVKAIQEYIRENNKSPRPFQWVASANTIVRKVRSINGLYRQETRLGRSKKQKSTSRPADKSVRPTRAVPQPAKTCCPDVSCPPEP